MSEPNTTLYEASSTTVPLDLRGGHYPFYRWMESRRRSWQWPINGFYDLPPGPHTLEIWVERAAGAGAASCQITRGYLEAYEVLH